MDARIRVTDAAIRYPALDSPRAGRPVRAQERASLCRLVQVGERLRVEFSTEGSYRTPVGIMCLCQCPWGGAQPRPFDCSKNKTSLAPLIDNNFVTHGGVLGQDVMVKHKTKPR